MYSYITISFVILMTLLQPISTLFPYTTLFRSGDVLCHADSGFFRVALSCACPQMGCGTHGCGCHSFSRGPMVANRVHKDRKSTRLNSSHGYISYAVFCLKKKNKTLTTPQSMTF